MKELSEQKKQKLAESIADGSIKDEQSLQHFEVLDELQTMNEKMDSSAEHEKEMCEEMKGMHETMKVMAEKEMPEMPEIPEVVFPEVQKVEVTNFPEQKAPIVNVTAPQPILVPAPEVNVPEVKFPDVQKVTVENPQKEVVLVDEDGKVIDLKELGEHIGKNIKVTGGGGGGLGAFSTYGAATDASITDQLSNYKISAGPIEDTGYLYIGYLKKDGAWYIKRQNTTTKVWGYVKGSSDFDTAWTAKSSQSYSNFNLTF